MSDEQALKDGQELVEAPETSMQVFDEYEQEIVQFEKYFADKKYDLTSEEGTKACEGDLLLLRKVEIRIDKTRKSRGKSLRDAVTELNASAKVCHNRVHAMYETIDAPLQVIRQKNLDEAMDKLEAEQAEIKAAEVKREAELITREAEVNAGLAKIAEADRKEEIEAAALLAAENATLQAKQDAINAEAQAKINTANAVAAEKKRVADLYETEQAEQRKIAADLAAKAANVEHQREFNNLALEALNALTDDPATSLRIVKAIVNREIPNVTLTY